MSTLPPADHSPTDPPAGDPPPAEAPDPSGTPRRWTLRRTRPAAAAAPGDAAAEPAGEDAQPTEAIPVPPRPAGPRSLRRDRRRLLTEREEAVYHLGGLAFELYRRDQLPDGVMRLRAGEVAQLDDTVRDIDVRLSEAERLRRERRGSESADPSVGCCLVCRTPFRPEARFCWQCGTQVVPPPLGGDDQPTAVISTPGPA